LLTRNRGRKIVTAVSPDSVLELHSWSDAGISENGLDSFNLQDEEMDSFSADEDSFSIDMDSPTKILVVQQDINDDTNSSEEEDEKGTMDWMLTLTPPRLKR